MKTKNKFENKFPCRPTVISCLGIKPLCPGWTTGFSLLYPTLNFNSLEVDRTRNTWIDNPVLSPIELPGRVSKGLYLNSLVLLFLVLFSSSAFSEIDLSAISTIESSNNPKLIGDHGNSLGLFQISSICLKDFNKSNNRSISRQELLSPEINKEVASWYLNVRIPQLLRNLGHPVTTANIIAAFNCGISCVSRETLPKSTQKYLKKYERLTHEKI